jgi:hypothetical protein
MTARSLLVMVWSERWSSRMPAGMCSTHGISAITAVRIMLEIGCIVATMADVLPNITAAKDVFRASLAAQFAPIVGLAASVLPPGGDIAEISAHLTPLWILANSARMSSPAAAMIRSPCTLIIETAKAQDVVASVPGTADIRHSQVIRPGCQPQNR